MINIDETSGAHFRYRGFKHKWPLGSLLKLGHVRASREKGVAEHRNEREGSQLSRPGQRLRWMIYVRKMD